MLKKLGNGLALFVGGALWHLVILIWVVVLYLQAITIMGIGFTLAFFRGAHKTTIPRSLVEARDTIEAMGQASHDFLLKVGGL